MEDSVELEETKIGLNFQNTITIYTNDVFISCRKMKKSMKCAILYLNFLASQGPEDVGLTGIVSKQEIILQLNSFLVKCLPYKNFIFC